MAVLSTLPTTTLTGDDIKDTINNYGGSADNTWLTFYDSLNDVNKWSRWKPFSYPADFVNDESILKAAHFGLQIDHMSNWGNVTTKWETQYVYNKPTGTSTSPYRGGDFRNYTKDAICFFSSFSGPTTVYQNNAGSYLFYFNVPTSGSITLSDIVVNGVAASNCYPGVVAYKKGTTNYYVITDSKTAGSNTQFGVSITFSTAYETWYVYPMLSSTAYTSWTLNPTNPTCVICLPASPVETYVNPLSALYQIGFNSCTVTEGVGRITTAMSVFMKNTGTSARTFNISYRVEGIKDGYSTELVGFTSIISQSVAAGATTSLSVSKVTTCETGFDYYLVTIQDTGTGFTSSWNTSEH